MNKDLRMMALESVSEYEKTGRKLDAIIHEKLKENAGLSSAQRRFYIRLTQGTVEMQYNLDHRIAAYSNTPLKKIRPVLLWILRIGAYQISAMDGTPDSAVVNEAVKMAEKKGFGRLKGFVNAVLRNMIRFPEKVVWPSKEEPVKYLSVRYSMPEYLSKKFLNAYGFETAEKICSAFLEKKPDAIHIKKTGNDTEKTLKSLNDDGIGAKPAPWPEGAYYLSEHTDLTGLGAFLNGEFFIQDVSSQLAVFASGIRPDDRILDVCAAPGGKSLLAADLLGGTGAVVSRDVSSNRVRTLRENIARMGFSNMTAEVRDALEPDEDSFGKFDIVLVDAPCSGYGVIGKKPDIKYTASAEKEEELAALQKKILHNAASFVKPGGTLIYSTCTINETENEKNAAWFLKEHDFKELPLAGRLPEELQCSGSILQLLPNSYHDGFFIAAFQKTAHR